MRAHWLFLLTHTVCGLFFGGAVAVMLLLGWANSWTLAAVAMAVTINMVIAWVLSTRLRHGLRRVELAAVKGENTAGTPSGIKDLDITTRRIGEFVQQWIEARNHLRTQATAVHRVLARLDRRSPRDSEVGIGSLPQMLRDALAGIITTIDGDLSRVVADVSEVARYTQEMAAGAEKQTDAVAKTTSIVEQMSTNIDTVSNTAKSAEAMMTELHDAAADAVELVRLLSQGAIRLRGCLDVGQRKLQTLGDRSDEIHAIVTTIAAISAQTDLLAINASIESIRAGEHGRGFAVVAAEIRKLAEQAGQAVREVTGLIESARLEIDDSIAGMGQERSELEKEINRTQSTMDVLARVVVTSKESAGSVGGIFETCERHLRLMQEFVSAVETISKLAKAGRKQADRTCWTAKALAENANQVDATLTPLRRCSGENLHGPAQRRMNRPENKDDPSVSGSEEHACPEELAVDADLNVLQAESAG